MSEYIPITVARGDGIGPEIMDATLKILEAAGAKLEIEEIEIGEKVYLSGIDTGLSSNAFSSLQHTKVFLKAPITTPRGGGYKSLNVTTRKAFGLYANVRPCKSYRPFIRSKHPDMDVVIIRENEEDVYAGIEHRQTSQVYQCLKLFSRAGTEKIIRYAFEYAREYGRKKVSLFVKDNIMKITDGLYHQVFKEIAPEYPEIENDTWIVDIGAARLADTPERFDVIVMSNLYGDILSDVAAQISGSIGLAGSSNIGEHLSMFEAIHGSAPDIAGKNLANPSGLLLSAVMMLVHIGQIAPAEAIHNAWFRTIENGIHTGDIFEQGISSVRVGTAEFAEAVISNLGKTPHELRAAHYYAPNPLDLIHASHEVPEIKKLVGVDVFIDWIGAPHDIGNQLDNVFNDSLKLKLITNRGIKVYPDGIKETFCTDHWRCRYKDGNWNEIDQKSILDLMSKINEAGFEIIKTENLYTFNDELGFSEAH
ncbi:MAG: NADP-dependent isocitrate dehydrogenase [Melioribacteraceae bacterium]|nr:NADP-dependent isocitrate dehydrogenase [Melioribacteraceae bacterium]